MTHPLDCPRSGCSRFEVSLYNQQVRDRLKDNQELGVFDERWANIHRQVVWAEDAAAAKTLAAKRYPPEQGFVIAKVDVRN